MRGMCVGSLGEGGWGYRGEEGGGAVDLRKGGKLVMWEEREKG